VNDGELKVLCRKWQKLLRLQDWEIDCRFADSIETHDQTGKCRAFPDRRQAIVRILRPEGFDLTDEFTQAFDDGVDPEMSLVHELIHIPLEKLLNEDPGEHEKVMQEQAIESIARALLDLDRRD
jgi:hypothetical protein